MLIDRFMLASFYFCTCLLNKIYYLTHFYCTVEFQNYNLYDLVTQNSATTRNLFMSSSLIKTAVYCVDTCHFELRKTLQILFL